MIDMRSLHSHSDYPSVLSAFLSRPDSSNCESGSNGWNIFTNIHQLVSNNKCPICECSLNVISRLSNNGNVTLTATIDHYRPKNPAFYPLLKCDHENYLLMCFDCNSSYKRSEFPLHSSTPNRDTTATNTRSITNERPLIINPIYDDVFELFELIFKQAPSGRKVLELAPKSSLDASDYLYEKAKETIRLFGLGNCEIDIHSNVNVQNCRIDVLSSHFDKFYKLLKALKDNNKEEAIQIIKLYDLKKYGFYTFIAKNQYKDLMPPSI